MSKQQRLNLKLSGLYTNPNQFSEIPQGALSKADNCVIDKGGVIESRRGYKKYGNQISLGPGEYINSLHIYRERLIVQYGSSLAYDSTGTGVWVDYPGTYNEIPGYKTRSVQQNGNLYFTTSEGIKKIQSLTGTPGSAGVPRALDGEGSTTGSAGWFPDSSNVAYRLVWGIRDDNNNLLLGSPSGRLVVANASGGSRDVSLTWLIPDGITTSYFYQVYRSPTAAASDEPSDELQLVYESNPSSAEITAQSLTFTDVTPDDLKGAFLYTSSSQQGITQANEQPPVAKDLCLYKQMMFYANTTQKERLTLTIIAVGTGGFDVGDTLTIDGVTYTGAAAEDPAVGEFQIFTAGTASENIENTALSLVRIVNKYASNTTIYAYYTSGFNDLPGQILFEERGVGATTFYATSSEGASFNPTVPASGTSLGSTDDAAQNRIYYSKVGEPEAVPLLNFLNAGSSDFPVERIIPLRDSVFIFKKDGVFRIIGEDPSSLRLSVFDNTSEIRGRATAVEIANTIYLYTDQGVISASDNGVQVMSRPIEDQLFQIENFTSFQDTAFSIAYESDRKYVFFCKTSAGDLFPSQAYVYNQFTNAWTRWTRDATFGLVLNNRIYYSSPDGYIFEERKDFNISDYQDDELPITITSSSGTTINYTGSTDPEAGWIVRQGVLESTVVSVPSAGVIEVEDTLAWSNGAALIIEPIECLLEWAQESCGNPGILKHFRETTLIMRDSSFKKLEIGYTTNFDLIPEYVEITPDFEGGWGTFPWGSLPWGGGTTAKPVPIRTYVPLEKRRGSWIYLRVRSTTAKTNFAISGVSLIYTTMSERFV